MGGINVFIYLIIGQQASFREEILCSLLSLKKVTSKYDFSVIIYSDHKFNLGHDFPFNVSVRVLAKDIVDEWLSVSNFVLALKPLVIKHFFDGERGNVLFIDTDTFFIKDPSPLFSAITNDAYVLHLEENSFKGRKNLKEYIDSKKFARLNTSTYSLDLEKSMWNSGVVGLNDQRQSVLPEIVHLIDQIRRDKKWHTVEQLAISYFFQHGKVVAADSYIVHYWFFKPIRQLLMYYFNIPTEGTKQFIAKSVHDNVLKRHIAFNELPDYSIKLFVRYCKIHDWHLYSLPKGTFIGQKLRRHMVGNVSFSFLRMKAWLRNLFHLNGMLEIEKADYDHR